MLVEDFKVKWQHEKGKGVTKCIIEKDNEEFSLGYAVCSVNDSFCYDCGRKVSMARALQPLSRKVRRNFWETYRNLTKTPRW